jgi:hypothetical protein
LKPNSLERSRTRNEAELRSDKYTSTSHSKKSRDAYPPRAYWPVPVSFITAGPSGAFSLTVAAPLIALFTLGVKVTLKVHVAPAATLAPQGVAPDPAAVKSPLVAMLDIVSVPPELLVSVTARGALVVPTV